MIGPIFLVTFLVIFLLIGEWRPRLPVRISRMKRWMINIGSGAGASLVAGLIWFLPLKLIPDFSLNGLDAINPDAFNWMRLILLFLVYDLALWGWHKLMHEADWLWVYHRFHHLDAELDTTTGLRFHPMEFVLSGAWRLVILLILNPSPAEWLLVTLTASSFALFHHSRIRLPAKLDNLLSLVVVTPDWHHTHHHPDRATHDSNYGVILTAWDRLFRTARQAPDERLGLYGASPTDSWSVGAMMRLW
ncbi:MAG: sterol desaturase family protein [Bacteroidetes bacterium]|nr:sterol desaturase family protein [Bacteroidota bacterium]